MISLNFILCLTISTSPSSSVISYDMHEVKPVFTVLSGPKNWSTFCKNVTSLQFLDYSLTILFISLLLCSMFRMFLMSHFYLSLFLMPYFGSGLNESKSKTMQKFLIVTCNKFSQYDIFPVNLFGTFDLMYKCDDLGKGSKTT